MLVYIFRMFFFLYFSTAYFIMVWPWGVRCDYYPLYALSLKRPNQFIQNIFVDKLCFNMIKFTNDVDEDGVNSKRKYKKAKEMAGKLLFIIKS